MSLRLARTGMGKTTNLPNSPGQSNPTSPTTPRSPLRDDVRLPSVRGEGIEPFSRNPGSPLRKGGDTPRFFSPGLVASPRGSLREQGAAQGQRTHVGGNVDLPSVRRSGDAENESQQRPVTNSPVTNMSWGHSSELGSARRQQTDAQSSKVDHDAADGIEKQIDTLKKRFLQRNETKMTSLQDIFRVADKDKQGSLGVEELLHAFEKVGGKAPPEVLHHLLSTRATDKERLSFNDFMRFFDDRSGNMCLLKRPKQAASGHSSKMVHLWVPTNPSVLGGHEFGTLNDVLVSCQNVKSGFRCGRAAVKGH